MKSSELLWNSRFALILEAFLGLEEKECSELHDWWKVKKTAKKKSEDWI